MFVVGRVHAFLEDINAINVDCPVIPQPRLARVRNYSELDKRNDKPMESWVSILRPRKRIHTVRGEWIDENTTEGVTITVSGHCFFRFIENEMGHSRCLYVTVHNCFSKVVFQILFIYTLVLYFDRCFDDLLLESIVRMLDQR